MNNQSTMYWLLSLMILFLPTGLMAEETKSPTRAAGGETTRERDEDNVKFESVNVRIDSPSRTGLKVKQYELPELLVPESMLFVKGSVQLEGQFEGDVHMDKVMPIECPLEFRVTRILNLNELASRSRNEGWPLRWRIEGEDQSDIDSNKKRSQKFSQILRLKVKPDRDGKFHKKLNFEFQIRPKKHWSAGYFAVDVTGVQIEKAGMFQVAESPIPWKSYAAKSIEIAATFLGLRSFIDP